MLAASASGCGSSDTITPSNFTSKYVDAVCANFAKCGGADSASECSALFNFEFALGAGTGQGDLDVADGKTTFNATQASACISALEALSCSQGNLLKNHQPTACANLVTGTIADGAACTANEQCKSGTCTGASSACATGTCAATLTVSAIGGSCDGTATTCDSSTAFCNAGTCTAYGAAGADCDSSNGQNTCANGNVCSNNVCVALPATGASCAGVGGCASIADQCYFVASTTGGDGTETCTTSVTRGASCAAAPCRFDSVCDATTKLCVAPPLVGEACPGQGATCEAGGFCKAPDSLTAGICTAPQANGTACQNGDECTSEFCTDTGSGGVCADFVACT